MTTDLPEETTVRPRVLARLAALSAVAVLTLLGAGVAQAAVPRVEEVTRAQARQLLPLCPVAWSVTDTDPRLPVGLSRPVVLATCIQHFPDLTRLTRSSPTAPTAGTPVPPGADGRPVAPIEVRIVDRVTGTRPEVVPTPAPPVTLPVPVPVPVPVAVPVPVPGPALTVTVVPAPPEAAAPGGSSPGPAPARAASNPASGGTSSGPAGGGSATGGAPDGSSTAGAAGAAGAEGTSADVLPAVAEVPAPPAEKASIWGLPGTVSDPAALAAQVAAATGTPAPALLVVALAVVVIVGLLLWWALRGQDLAQRLRGVLSRAAGVVGRGGADRTGPAVGTDEVAPADLVDRWLHADTDTGTDTEVAVPAPREPHGPTTVAVPSP